MSAQAEPRPVRGGALVDGRDPRRARVPRLHSWLKVPSSLFEDPTRPARLVPSRAQAAPTYPRAPPEQLGSLPWAQPPASARPQVEDASTLIHQAPGRTTSTTPSARRSRWAASSSCSASQLVGGRALHTLFEDAAPSARLVAPTAQVAPTHPRAQEPAWPPPKVGNSARSTPRLHRALPLPAPALRVPAGRRLGAQALHGQLPVAAVLLPLRRPPAAAIRTRSPHVVAGETRAVLPARESTTGTGR